MPDGSSEIAAPTTNGPAGTTGAAGAVVAGDETAGAAVELEGLTVAEAEAEAGAEAGADGPGTGNAGTVGTAGRLTKRALAASEAPAVSYTATPVTPRTASAAPATTSTRRRPSRRVPGVAATTCGTSEVGSEKTPPYE